MIKFIYEVDEEFVHQNADVSDLRNKMTENKGDSFGELLLCLSMSLIEKQIKNGKREFIFKEEDVGPGDREYFRRAITISACLLATSINQNDELP